MQDRYLYRAKRTDNGEWVEGSYVYTLTEDEDCLCVGIHKENHYIVTERGYMTEVDPSTICQCTAVPDKNSKIAYEHDIIKTQVGYAKIEWNYSPSPTDHHINVGFEVFFLDATANDNYRHDLGYWIGKSDVIGSAFDNPELLEAGE